MTFGRYIVPDVFLCVYAMMLSIVCLLTESKLLKHFSQYFFNDVCENILLLLWYEVCNSYTDSRIDEIAHYYYK